MFCALTRPSRMGGFLGLEYGGRSVMLRIGHVHIQYDDLRTMIESSDEIKKMTQDIRSVSQSSWRRVVHFSLSLSVCVCV